MHTGNICISHRPRHHEAADRLAMAVGPGGSTDDVLIAAYDIPGLMPDNTIDITMPEREEAAEEVLETTLGPGGFLVGEGRSFNFYALYGEVTDVFTEDGTPLFYFYVCRHPAVNPEPSGVSIEVDGRINPPDAKYRAVFVPYGKYYRLYLYTAFGPGLNCAIHYYGLTGDSAAAKMIKEEVMPLPVTVPYEVVANKGAAGIPVRIYTPPEYGVFQLQTDDHLVHDPRRPIPFRYTVKAAVLYPDGHTKVVLAPWRSETVLNVAALTACEAPDYILGNKKLGSVSARELVAPYLGNLPPGSIVTYTALVDSEAVEVYCRPDGEGPVYARTDTNTGTIPEFAFRPGKKWVYLKYTQEVAQTFGLRMAERKLDIVFSTEKNGLEFAATSHSVQAPYGFGETEIAVTADELPEADADSFLHVNLVNRPFDIDIQVVVGGTMIAREDGALAVPWPEVVAAGGITVKLKEIYQEGAFSRVYAVRLIRKAPPLLRLPEGDTGQEWRLRLTAGRIEKKAPDGSIMVYCTGMPVLRRATESVTPDSNGAVRLRHKPLAVSYNHNGDIIGIEPYNQAARFTVVSCNPQEGTIQLRIHPEHRGAVVVQYWYISWEKEYTGFTKDGEFHQLDLNPQSGHMSSFVHSGPVPTGTLFNTCIHIYAYPCMKLDYYRRAAGETLSSLGYSRFGSYGLVLLLQSQYRIDRNRGVRIFCYDTGEEIPYGSGNRYWLYHPHASDRVLIINPDTEADMLGQPLKRYIIDYWHPTSVPCVTENRGETVCHWPSALADDEALLLGRVRIGFNFGPANVRLVDARQRGGGVKTKLLPQARALEPQSSHYFDLGYWGGEPWQDQGTAVVLLPREILDSWLDSAAVEEAVKRHAAAGILPIVRYWDAAEMYPQGSRHLSVSIVDDVASGFTPPTHLTAGIVSLLQ